MSKIIWEVEGNFPHDWIAPGEYRYCGCGYILLPPNETICAKCRYRNQLGHDDEKGVCKKLSEQLHAEREALAQKRKAEGVKKLFWIEKC